MPDNINLAQYLADSIKEIIKNALAASAKKPKETAFLLRFMASSKRAERARMRHENDGRHVPAFLIASIAKRCNLSCSGCYARANKTCCEVSAGELSDDQWADIFSQAEDAGISFILLAGGEPLMRRDVILRAAEFKNIIFPIFTNGTLAGEYVELFDKNRNLLPVVSIEGGSAETDKRRGAGVYSILTGVMESFKDKGIFFGTSITVTTENLDLVTGCDSIAGLNNMGCKLVFFIEYVPVEPESRGLAPTDEQREALDRRLSVLREQFPDMLFLSFPGDERYMGGCLAAGRGFFHINADGGAEPCPFSPYSDVSLKDHTLLEALDSELFRRLELSGLLSGEHTGACVLFEKDDQVKELTGL